MSQCLGQYVLYYNLLYQLTVLGGNWDEERNGWAYHGRDLLEPRPLDVRKV